MDCTNVPTFSGGLGTCASRVKRGRQRDDGDADGQDPFRKAKRFQQAQGVRAKLLVGCFCSVPLPSG